MERVAVVELGQTTINGSAIVVPDDVAPVEELAAPLVTLAPMAVAEEFSDAEAGIEPEAAPEEPLPPAAVPEEETPVAAVSPEEPAAVAAVPPEEAAPAEEPVATADAAREEPEAKAEATPTEKSGVFDKFNWPKIRIDR